MKLSEMRQVLDERAIQLTKSLGQNFLHDANQLKRIVDAAQLGPGDKVLEIGPGLGPLTAELLKRAGHVLAIEKDSRLADFLAERFRADLDSGKLELVRADALDHLKREARDWTEWSLVANLPYSVASPILVELAMSLGAPRRMVATLQHEVAKRLMAATNDPDYGILTLLVQFAFQPKEMFRIPASCFFPEPDVVSGCIVLERRAERVIPAGQEAVFAKIVKRAFSQRRKMMLKLLRHDWPDADLERVWAEQGLSPQARAETVSLQQFAALTRALAGGGNA